MDAGFFHLEDKIVIPYCFSDFKLFFTSSI